MYMYDKEESLNRSGLSCDQGRGELLQDEVSLEMRDWMLEMHSKQVRKKAAFFRTDNRAKSYLVILSSAGDAATFGSGVEADVEVVAVAMVVADGGWTWRRMLTMARVCWAVVQSVGCRFVVIGPCFGAGG